MEITAAHHDLSRRDVLKVGAAGLAFAAGGRASSDASAQPQAPKRGGTFRIRGEDPVHFDPHLTQAFRTMTNLSFAYSRLVKVKAGSAVVPNTMPIEPDVAESWTQPNDTTYIFKLKKGVRFHPKPPVNGRELTAEDVKWTYERFLTLPGNPNRGALEAVDRIEALDKYTVKFTLKEPFAWFIDMLASTYTWILAREVAEKLGDFKRPESCIGTGPWMLERYEPGVRLTFVRHPNYFVPNLPHVDTVEVGIDNDVGSRTAAWLAGAYDFAPEFGQVVRRLDLDVARKRKPALQTREHLPVFGGITWMKIEKPPFNDVRVRRALARAYNGQEVLDAGAWSLGKGAHNPAIPAALKEWSIPLDQLTKDGRDLYEHDPKAARKLLADAGLVNGFKPTIETTAGYGADWMDAVEITLKNWKAAGIDGELKLKEYGAFISSTIFGKFDLLAIGLFGAWADADSYLYRLHMPGQMTNAAPVNDARLTEMIRLQRRTFDVAKRRDIIWDIQRYCAQQVYYGYGITPSAVSAWEPYVKNFGPNIGFDYGGRLMVAWLDK
jgi:peptide/nickel transport system substrate-binding protein